MERAALRWYRVDTKNGSYQQAGVVRATRLDDVYRTLMKGNQYPPETLEQVCVVADKIREEITQMMFIGGFAIAKFGIKPDGLNIGLGLLQDLYERVEKETIFSASYAYLHKMYGLSKDIFNIGNQTPKLSTLIHLVKPLALERIYYRDDRAGIVDNHGCDFGGLFILKGAFCTQVRRCYERAHLPPVLAPTSIVNIVLDTLARENIGYVITDVRDVKTRPHRPLTLTSCRRRY